MNGKATGTINLLDVIENELGYKHEVEVEVELDDIRKEELIDLVKGWDWNHKEVADMIESSCLDIPALIQTMLNGYISKVENQKETAETLAHEREVRESKYHEFILLIAEGLGARFPYDESLDEMLDIFDEDINERGMTGFKTTFLQHFAQVQEKSKDALAADNGSTDPNVKNTQARD